MSSLQDFGDVCLQNHGLAPMASACRRFAASRNVTKLNFVGISIEQVEIFRPDIDRWRGPAVGFKKQAEELRAKTKALELANKWNRREWMSRRLGVLPVFQKYFEILGRFSIHISH